MSLEILDRLFRNWKDPTYKGFAESLFKYHTSGTRTEENANISSRAQIDSDNGNYLTYSTKHISEFGTDRNDLFEFYANYNIKAVVFTRENTMAAYRMYNFPVSVLMTQLWDRYLRTDFKNILDIGFSSGFVSLNVFNTTNAKVLTIDKFYYQHYWYGKNFIDEKYPGRHLMVTEKTKYPSKYLEKYCPNIKFDIISFNKSRKFESIYRYFINFKKYATPDTIILLNSPSPQHTWGIGPYIAMNRVINDSIATLVEYADLDGMHFQTMAVLKYNFEENYSQTLQLKNYVSMEKEIPQMLLYNYVLRDYEEKLGKVNYDMINKYAKKFASFDLKFNDKLLKILKEKFNIIPNIYTHESDS